MVPSGTSTPRNSVDISAYSPISEPDTAAVKNSNNNNKSKSSIVMPDNTIDVSMSSSLANVKNSSIDVVTLDTHVDDVNDTDVPDFDPNIVIDHDVDVSKNVTTDNVDKEVIVKTEPLPSFPDNVLPLPHLSVTKRVSTAYKYYSFPRKPVPERQVPSEAHGSDEEIPKSDEVIENSFPVNSSVLKGWQDQSKAFKNSLKEALVMDKENQPSESAQSESQGNKKKDDEATLFSKSTPSILKNKPTRKQGDFYYHEEKFGQFVQLDSNIELLTPAGFEPGSYKLQVSLTEDEVKNMQLAMSYGLHAESHASSYITASRKAINQALVKLDPEKFSEQIKALQDAKHMLYGATNASDFSIQKMIYIHAGLTASMRTDFLKSQTANIPSHVMQNLLYAQFGGSALFNSQISKYTNDIELQRQKEHQSSLQHAVIKSQGQQPPKRTDGYVHPSAPPLQNQGQGRGGFNSANRGRGNGGSHRGRGNHSGNNFQQNRQPNRPNTQNNRGRPKPNYQGNRNSHRKRKN